MYFNREVQFPGRIRLISTGKKDVYDVAREEGEIRNEGTLMSAELLNRIDTALSNKANKHKGNLTWRNVQPMNGWKLFSEYDGLKFAVTDSGVILDGLLIAPADSVLDAPAAMLPNDVIAKHQIWIIGATTSGASVIFRFNDSGAISPWGSFPKPNDVVVITRFYIPES